MQRFRKSGTGNTPEGSVLSTEWVRKEKPRMERERFPCNTAVKPERWFHTLLSPPSPPLCYDCSWCHHQPGTFLELQKSHTRDEWDPSDCRDQLSSKEEALQSKSRVISLAAQDLLLRTLQQSTKEHSQNYKYLEQLQSQSWFQYTHLFWTSWWWEFPSARPWCFQHFQESPYLLLPMLSKPAACKQSTTWYQKRVGDLEKYSVVFFFPPLSLFFSPLSKIKKLSWEIGYYELTFSPAQLLHSSALAPFPEVCAHQCGWMAFPNTCIHHFIWPPEATFFSASLVTFILKRKKESNVGHQSEAGSRLPPFLPAGKHPWLPGSVVPGSATAPALHQPRGEPAPKHSLHLMPDVPLSGPWGMLLQALERNCHHVQPWWDSPFFRSLGTQSISVFFSTVQ